MYLNVEKCARVLLFKPDTKPWGYLYFYGLTAHDLMQIPCEPLQEALRRRPELRHLSSSPFYIEDVHGERRNPFIAGAGGWD